VLVILEGRDAAGKDGAAKRIAEHLSPRETGTLSRCLNRRPELGSPCARTYSWCSCLSEASVDSGAKRNEFMRSGFECLCQAL
jgi:hypothetical protein